MKEKEEDEKDEEERGGYVGGGLKGSWTSYYDIK